MGERVAARPDLFPAGANLSVLLPLGPAEVFVRTFERGAGLTASCGSGMAASRAVYSRVGRIDPERRVVVRNAGGMATVSLEVRQGRWHPVLEGNATFVYRAEVDPARLDGGDREPCSDEVRAYAALDEQNARRLRAAGIETAAWSHQVRLAGLGATAARTPFNNTYPGSRTMRAPGRTETLSVRPGAMISPSTCRGRAVAALTWIRRAWKHSSARSPWRSPRPAGRRPGASTRPGHPAPSPRCRRAPGCPRRAARRRVWPRAAG